MDADELLRAIDLVRSLVPVGSPAAMVLALLYEAVVVARAVQRIVDLDALRAELAKKLGNDVADILKERFGG